MKLRLSKTVRVLILIGAVYGFLLSINLLGDSLNLLGKGFITGLISSTSNPFIGLFIGILATSLVQSSSVTTAIVVAFVGTGTLSITNAIPIIMGANIGTTVTNILVSMAHITRRGEFERAFSAAVVHDFFNLLCVLVFFLWKSISIYRESLLLFSRDVPRYGRTRDSQPFKDYP